MPWPKEHKEQTRQRIVEAAAAAFRKRGDAGVRVNEIMGDAGLTRGGFYAHFGSKDDLLLAALDHASGQTLEHLSELTRNVPAERRLHELIDAYLSVGHAAHPEQGCPVAALGPEIARAGGKRRQRLSRGIRGRIEWMRSLLPPRMPRRRGPDPAVGVLACMIGGLILARAVSERESAAVLEATREFLHSVIE